MRALVLVVAGALLTSACSSEVSSPGAGGSGGSGGVGASGGGGAGASGGGGAGGGEVACGGFSGATCAADAFCDYDPASACGGDDSQGVCRPRPDACPEDCPGVCACDGAWYCNACEAHAAGVDDSPFGCGEPACATFAAEIASKTSVVGSCTTAVRLDYTTLAILGHSILCGPYAALDEVAARAEAQASAGFGAAGASLAGATPEDEFVFYEAPGDFGGAAAVSARSGMTVFGGGIVWAGAGDITYPSSWEPPGSLGAGCVAPAPPPSARGFDLGVGGPLSQPAVDAALDVVWGTALPEGLWQSGYVFDAVVLLYPRSVGAFDPTTAEWIVLVNSGWLE